MEQLSDGQLVVQYREGNEQAFQVLLNRHKNVIFHSIYTFTTDYEASQDIFQEVFIKIIDRIRDGRYNEQGSFVHWACRIARNLCIDTYRKVKRRPTVTNASTDGEVNAFSFIENKEKNSEEALIDDQLKERIMHLVDTLSPEQREVVVLRLYGELSFNEIAEQTGVSINTALGRMRYAIINMRKVSEEKGIKLF